MLFLFDLEVCVHVCVCAGWCLKSKLFFFSLSLSLEAQGMYLSGPIHSSLI